MEFKIRHGYSIEEREEEVLSAWGTDTWGTFRLVRVANPPAARNLAFDVTPANLITGIITPKGIVKPANYGARASVWVLAEYLLGGRSSCRANGGPTAFIARRDAHHGSAEASPPVYASVIDRGGGLIVLALPRGVAKW